MFSIFEMIMETGPQNALLVDDRVNEQVELLAAFPMAGKEAKRRKRVIDKASSVVIYRVEEDAIPHFEGDLWRSAVARFALALQREVQHRFRHAVIAVA
jgi:plasmid stabilization system protein ParE